MKAKNIFFGVVIGLSLISCSIQTPQKQERSVTVTGSGTVSAKPDKAIISLAVETSSKDVIKAADDNATKMNEIQNNLIAEGFSNDSITTSNYRIYQESSTRNGVTIKGDYVVANFVTIEIVNIANVGKAIDIAVKAGANKLTSVDFIISNNADLIRQARVIAMKNASESASLMAGASGAKLGKILIITEDGEPNVIARTMLYEAANSSSTPINPGDSTVSVSVRCTYELE